MALGEAWVDIHARKAASFDKEVEADLRTAGRDAEHVLDGVGKDWGAHISRSMSDEVRQHGAHDVAHAFEEQTKHEKVKVRWEYNYDRDGILRGSRKIVTAVEQAVSDGFQRAFSGGGGAGGGGIFGGIASGIQDAVGAGFNVSGKSSLIVFLVPLVGAIVALVLAAIQAVGALVAVIYTVPAALIAVGLQAGVLYAVFSGMGKAIRGAFNAKNATEFNAAIKGLTPAAQDFVRSLLPVRDLFRDLKTIAQSSFFKSFGNTIAVITSALGPTLKGGFASLATSLGGFFRELGLFFASPTFKEFLNKIIPATNAFLKAFGPNLVVFLDGLTRFTTTAMPFLDKLGDMLGGNLFWLGKLLGDLAKDPKSAKWFSSMQKTFESVVELFGQAVVFLAVFMDELDKAGGEKVIRAFADALAELAFFLSSEAGRRAMISLVEFSIFSIEAVTGLIITILTLFASIQAFFSWLKNDAGPGILNFLQAIGQGFVDFFKMIGDFLYDLWRKLAFPLQSIGDSFTKIWLNAREAFSKVVDFVTSIPGRITAAVGDLGSLLVEKGRSLIRGLIAGIQSMFGSLGGVLGQVARRVGGFFGLSPAKEGPLSGSGWMEPRGRRLIRALNEGIKAETRALSTTMTQATTSIALGGIALNFYGQQPTEADARRMGTAAGTAMTTQLAVRDVRLAVRSQ